MDLEEILARHRKELRDLTNTITLLKKQATKKTRKNVVTKCNEMEQNLKAKHAEEIAAANSEAQSPTGNDVNEVDEGTIAANKAEVDVANVNTDEEITPESLLAALELEKEKASIGGDNSNNNNSNNIQNNGQKKKRNRAKERLARRQQEIEKIQEEARKEMENVPDYRELELEAMKAKINEIDLTLYEIQPDGNCLFTSIQDQLIHRHNMTLDGNKTFQPEDETETDDESEAENDSKVVKIDTASLRQLAAEYIQANRDDFAPFMYNEETDTLEDIDEYCDKLTSTILWGSDKEVLAFANIFDSPISILSYDTGSKSVNNLIINEQGKRPQLYLAYYKHSYGLGEHYNSLR